MSLGYYSNFVQSFESGAVVVVGQGFRLFARLLVQVAYSLFLFCSFPFEVLTGIVLYCTVHRLTCVFVRMLLLLKATKVAAV